MIKSFGANFATRGGMITDEVKHDHKTNWRSIASTNKLAVSELLKIIETSPLGMKLVARARLKARKTGHSLLEVIESGEVSVTDTTLIRRFSADNPSEVNYEARSKVILDESHNVKNAVLDLAHELTHYVFKTPFNPYIKNFSITKFMVDTIEGRGGEVDAFVVECKIGRAIFGNSGLSSQCKNIQDSTSKFSRKLAKREFYKLGAHYQKFVGLSKKHHLNLDKLNNISDGTSGLISSAWGEPYPLAVFSEYESIMGRVCQNDRRRLKYFATSKSRKPASALKELVKQRKRVMARCKYFFE